ncbi:MAG: hypothetical protein RLZZ568_418 [Cyanobacteriota bacterium]
MHSHGVDVTITHPIYWEDGAKILRPKADRLRDWLQAQLRHCHLSNAYQMIDAVLTGCAIYKYTKGKIRSIGVSYNRGWSHQLSILTLWELLHVDSIYCAHDRL